MDGSASPGAAASETDFNAARGPLSRDWYRIGPNRDRPPMRLRELIALLREDRFTHGRDWTRPGFRAVAAYRFGVFAMGVRAPVLGAALRFVWRLAHRHARNAYGIEIYASAKIGRRFLVGHQSGIVVHEWADIGDDCVVRQGVTMGIALGKAWAPGRGPVLGDRVDIGAGAILVGNLTIGDDVRIAPNAVVMTDVPANASVIASPGKILKAAPAGAPS